MHKKKDKLVKTTDKTMRRLINDDIITPSKYLETFAEEMKKIDHTHDNDVHEEEIMINAEDLKNIEQHLFTTDKDYFKHVKEVKSDIMLLRKQIFSDDITEAKNRLWIFKHELSDHETFKRFGFLVSTKITDYREIVKEYDSNVGNRLLKQVSDYMVHYMKDNHLNYEIVRYMDDNFLIFMHSLKNEDEVEEHMVNMQKGMANYKFKHRNKIFRLTFYFAVMQYIKNESFSSVLDQLDDKLFQNKI